MARMVATNDYDLGGRVTAIAFFFRQKKMGKRRRKKNGKWPETRKSAFTYARRSRIRVEMIAGAIVAALEEGSACVIWWRPRISPLLCPSGSCSSSSSSPPRARPTDRQSRVAFDTRKRGSTHNSQLSEEKRRGRARLHERRDFKTGLSAGRASSATRASSSTSAPLYASASGSLVRNRPRPRSIVRPPGSLIRLRDGVIFLRDADRWAI